MTYRLPERRNPEPIYPRYLNFGDVDLTLITLSARESDREIPRQQLFLRQQSGVLERFEIRQVA